MSLDLTGRRLAVPSDDSTIKIFSIPNKSTEKLTINPSTSKPDAILAGHRGPVWMVKWAHPRYGPLLASVGYDRRVLLWKETTPGNWMIIYRYIYHLLSVNTIDFAPHEYGLMFAVGSSDGHISVHRYNRSSSEPIKPQDPYESKKPPSTDSNPLWVVQKFSAHISGVTTLCWAPPDLIADSSIKSGDDKIPIPSPRLITGGCDNRIILWKYDESSPDSMIQDHEFEKMGDWVRCVSFSPRIAFSELKFAACSEDGTVKIWSNEEDNTWKATTLHKFTEPAWNLSFNHLGQVLAVSHGKSGVSLFRYDVDKLWKLEEKNQSSTSTTQ